MESRKRLYHWLRQNVEDNKFGLKWVNKEEQIFSIPWVHKHSRGWNKEYCRVFKEWAKFTNRFHEGAPEDWPGWKTRLRTALNKLPYFEEIHSLHRLEDIEKPYKVYQFVPKEIRKSSVESPSSNAHASPNSSATSPNSSAAEENSPCSFAAAESSPYGLVPTESSPSSHNMRFERNLPVFDALSPSFDIQAFRYQNPGLNNMSCQIQFSPSSTMANIQTSPMNIPSSKQEETANFKEPPFVKVTQSHGYCQDLDSLPSDLRSLESNHLVSKFPSSDMEMYNNEMTVSSTSCFVVEYNLFYLGENVKHGYVNDIGAYFHFGPEISFLPIPNLYGAKDLERIEFPDVSVIQQTLNSEQEQHFRDILTQLERGFTLKCSSNRNILLQRLCRTRIFARSSMIGQRNGNQSLCLDRKSKTETPIFDMNSFEENPQSPEIFLTFAQDTNPLDSHKKCLMYMELIPLRAKAMYQKLAPPDHKHSLQFSNCDSGDHIVEHLKKLAI